MGSGSNRQTVLAVVAGLVLLIAVGLIFSRSTGGGASGAKQVYFYAIDTGDLFAAENAMTAIDAPAGGKAVRAYVYSCGSCDDAAARFAGYVQKFTDEAAIAVTNVTPDSEQALREGDLVALPQDAGGELQWVVADSDAGQRIQDAAMGQCEQPQPCQP